jgi:hypothetical protein
MLLMGIAAIAAVVNGPGLGDDIFAGLARIGGANALILVLGGTLPGILVLALLFDPWGDGCGGGTSVRRSVYHLGYRLWRRRRTSQGVPLARELNRLAYDGEDL